jgi:hypothetical protein
MLFTIGVRGLPEGFDAVAKQATLESEFFHGGLPSETTGIASVDRPKDRRE